MIIRYLHLIMFHPEKALDIPYAAPEAKAPTNKV